MARFAGLAKQPLLFLQGRQRNLAFLFSRNRLNIAISRAQCLAYLVCSPRLLEARCRTIEEMELVNALCGLAEYVQRQPI